MTTRAQNRADFPFAAEKVDELRTVFGAGVKLLWASENGREIGQRSPDGIVAVVGPNIESIKKSMGRSGA